MDPESQRERQLRHLEEQRQRMNQHLDQQQARINEQFARRRDRMQQRLSQKRDEIISGALELLNEEGINELSLRKLARKLNIQAPALYWYFESKENLIDHLAEEILARRFTDLTPCGPDEDWKEWFMNVCFTLRDAMLEYRDGARVVAGAHLYPAVTLLRIFEASLESLSNNGLSLEKARTIITTAVHYTFGNAIEIQAAPAPKDVDEFIVGEFIKKFPLFAEVQHKLADDAGRYDTSYRESIELIINS